MLLRHALMPPFCHYAISRLLPPMPLFQLMLMPPLSFSG